MACRAGLANVSSRLLYLNRLDCLNGKRENPCHEL